MADLSEHFWNGFEKGREKALRDKDARLHATIELFERVDALQNEEVRRACLQALAVAIQPAFVAEEADD